ncbi:MAG: ABC transporter ATP-binding protein [Mycoplasma sp.]|nr:ABC transporter ATP-binding protein [Mycoplasma sp.]
MTKKKHSRLSSLTQPGKQKFKDNITLSKLWTYFKSSKKFVILTIVIGIFSAACAGGAIYISGYIYNNFLTSPEPDPFPIIAFSYVCIVLMLTNILTALFDFLVTIIFSKIVEYKVCYKMRQDIFNKIQRLSIYYLDQNASGELITKTSNDIDNISTTFTWQIVRDIPLLFNVIVIIILMALLNWALCLITLLIFPLMIFITSKAMNLIRPYYKKQQECTSDLNSFVEERISGNKIVSLYEKQDLNLQEFKKLNDDLSKNSVIANGFANILPPLNMLFTNLAFVILVALGISLTCLGYIKTSWSVIGNFGIESLLVVFTIFARNIANPINQIITSIGPITLMLVSANRVFDILSQDEEPNAKKPVELKNAKGYIEAKNLCFAYDKKGKQILKNINFKCEPGKTIALVGPTGCGKTTLASLLSRFYEVTSGDLLIDGVRIQDISRSSLHENITIVLQDTFLFNTTIRENIRYGKLDASDEEIEVAAKFAKAHDFIMNMLYGYETMIEDNGTNLSQGQRQSIVIARAFLREAKILILDEATSSIDTKTENDIQNSLKLLMSNKTSIIIAHRLSTIRNADNILVMKSGEIIEHGTHNKLIKKNGFYAKLYNAQFKKHESI